MVIREEQPNTDLKELTDNTVTSKQSHRRRRYSSEMKSDNKKLFIESKDAMFEVNREGQYVDSNPAARALTGRTNEELKTMTTFDFTRVVPHDRSSDNRNNSDEIAYKLPTGEERFATYQVIKLESGNFYVVAHDITEQRLKEERLLHQSTQDNLTGIYNRNFFDEELKRYDASRKLPITIAILDVNGLKILNDNVGHIAGDKLLKEVAIVLKKICRSYDVVARIGGDEFAMLLPDTSYEGAKILVERIKAECEKHYIEGVQLSIAIGIATKEDFDVSLEEVRKSADENMYWDKSERQRKLNDLAKERNEDRAFNLNANISRN